MRLPAVDRQIPDFVDDDQAGRKEGLALTLRLLELADQRLHGREVDLKPVAASLDGQGDRQVRLPTPGGPRKMTFSWLVRKGRCRTAP